MRSTLSHSLTFGLLITIIPMSTAADDKPDPRVSDVTAKVEGKTYAEWSAAWWQWGISIKKERNPILDKTGAFAAEGQDGPVFFLAGNSGGKTSRKCTVPANKPIFLPIINYIESDVPDKADEKKLLSTAKTKMDAAQDVQATLDDKPIAGLDHFRVASAIFTFTGPDKADAAFEDCFGKQKAASDGYWLMLKPLTPGKHTLHFKAKVKPEQGKDPFELDVTYELTVEEKK
jgi:hypothetical protein